MATSSHHASAPHGSRPRRWWLPLRRGRPRPPPTAARDRRVLVVYLGLGVLAALAGLWLLASAGLRYAFLVASHLDRRLAAPLPPLIRRKAIYVAQATSPILALIPLCPTKAALLLCISAFGLVLYSFAADCRWLLSHTD